MIALRVFLIIGIYALLPITSQAQTVKLDNNKVLTRIAFGSCNKHDAPQPLWNPILSNNPELWIWLGDNVYGDTEDMDLLKSKFDAQKAQADYAKLVSQVPVVGIWDDHDFGVNDGGREYSQRASSQQLLLDFLDVPQDAPQRTQKGIYASYTVGQAGKTIKFILLDTRYFRDNLTKRNKRYNPNFGGTILGDKQWEWLEKELNDSQADIHIIASSIQVIPMQHGYEKWFNFPKERQKLFNMLAKKKIKNVVFLSGDRHIGEISEIEVAGRKQPLYEVTSSGLTHTWSTVGEEANRFRKSDLIAALNFGLLQVDWDKKEMTLQIRGEENKVLGEKKIALVD